MVKSHSKSFFGQNAGIILTSKSRSEPYIFINCIKMKPNGTWEKISNNEGIILKLSLEEMVSILCVLNRQIPSWQNTHNYKNKKTSFSFSWQDESSKILWINVNKYTKMLNPAQTEILRLLMTHILHEKIVHSTSIDSEPKTTKNNEKWQDENCDYIMFEKQSIIDLKETNKEMLTANNVEEFLLNKVKSIESLILNETEKALMLKLGEDDVWIPKSTIHNDYDPIKGKVQNFLISNWVLKKYKTNF